MLSSRSFKLSSLFKMLLFLLLNLGCTTILSSRSLIVSSASSSLLLSPSCVFFHLSSCILQGDHCFELRSLLISVLLKHFWGFVLFFSLKTYSSVSPFCLALCVWFCVLGNYLSWFHWSGLMQEINLIFNLTQAVHCLLSLCNYLSSLNFVLKGSSFWRCQESFSYCFKAAIVYSCFICQDPLWFNLATF